MSPTIQNYTNLQEAYDFLNRELFNSELPACLITYDRTGKNTLGFFVNDRFQNKNDHDNKTDEISLNPKKFNNRTTKEIIATLTHEMCHLWQAHYGKPSRNGYHNAEWVTKMAEVGLIASKTGEPGGKQTGQQMHHYILEGGVFDTTVTPLLDTTILFEDRELNLSARKIAKKKRESKTKYTCIGCNANIWGKPNLSVKCNECELDFVSYDTRGEDE